MRLPPESLPITSTRAQRCIHFNEVAAYLDCSVQAGDGTSTDADHEIHLVRRLGATQTRGATR